MNRQTVQFVSTIPGWLTTGEGRLLEFLARGTDRTGEIVEIGSYCGKSTIWISQGKKRVFAIDPHKGDFSGGKAKPTLSIFTKNLQKAGVAGRVTSIVQTSAQAAKNWKKPIALLFIDGLHDQNHARQDFSLWSKHVVEGGIVAMHDAFCGWEGAGQVAENNIIFDSDFPQVGVVGSIVYGVKGKETLLSRLDKLRFQMIFPLATKIYQTKKIPYWIKFFVVHRFLRVFLITNNLLRIWFGLPAGKNTAGK